MKQAFLLYCTIFLFSIYSFSEITKTTSFVKNKIDGDNIIKLNPNVIIYASDPVHGWCKTKLFIIIDKAFVENDEYILAGATVKDYYRKSPIIGKIIKKINPSEIFMREDGNYEALIDGFISYESIDIKSIPERILENILSSNTSFIDPKLVSFIQEYDFTKRDDIAGYQYWEIFDLVPEEAQTRIGLFFDKNNQLIAIMNNKRLINYQFAKSIELERNYQLHLLQSNLPTKLIETLKSAISISE